MEASDRALLRALPKHRSAALAILAARRLVTASFEENVVGTQVDVQDAALHKYLHQKLRDSRRERLHAVFCDHDRTYIADDTICLGGADHLTLNMRHVFERALDCGASGILLAHNHPSGSVLPSASDIRATERIAELATAMELELIDHLVITKRSIFSIKRGEKL